MHGSMRGDWKHARLRETACAGATPQEKPRPVVRQSSTLL